MCAEKSGLVEWMREKLQRENCSGELAAYPCILHMETLCGKVLGMDNVMSILTQTVNLMQARGFDHRQFQAFLKETQSSHNDVPY